MEDKPATIIRDAKIIITDHFMKQFFLLRILVAIVFSLGATMLLAQSEGDTLHLSEVEILGKKSLEFPGEIIRMDQLKYLPVRDIGDFLRMEPNVSGIRKGGVAIDPVVRGFKYNQVTVLLNGGVKIEGGCPNRMDPVASHVESENIRDIEIIKGPYVLKYGPVLGALINLETNLPHPYSKPEIHGSVLYGFETNWNGQREHISLEGGNSKIFFNASGGFKGYGSYTGGNDVLYNSSFQKMYGSAGVGFVLKKNHQIILNYNYDEGRNILFPALPMDERSDITQYASLHYQAGDIGGKWKQIEGQVYYSSVHHVMDNLDRASSKTMQAVTTVEAWNAGGKLTGIVQAGVFRLQPGIDYEHIYKDGDKQMTMKMVMDGDTFISVKHANVWKDAVINNFGAFTEGRVSLSGTDITASLRFDYNMATSGDTFRLVKNDIHYFDDLNSAFFNVSFGIGIRQRIASWLHLNASLGRGTRSPSVLERFIKLMPVQYDAYDYLGNPQLKPEKNHQADLSFTAVAGPAGSITAGGFFSLVTDYIIGTLIPSSVIKPATQGSPGVKQFNNVDLAYLTGFEVAYQSPEIKKWIIHAGIAATYGTQPEAVKYLISGGQVVGEETVNNDPLPEIPPLEGTLAIGYKFFSNKLVPRVSLRLVSEQNRVSQSYGELATPGFITGAASLSYAPCKYAFIVAGVENVFNTPYYEHLNRRIVGSPDRLYEPGRVFYTTVSLRF
jgi:iron complex outermembrane receptor protein